MGAKNSKVKKGENNGVAGTGESPDVVDRTATLPASFKQKEEAAIKTETLPRNLSRSTSFTNSCRNWAKKKGLVKDKIIDSEVEIKESVKENGTADTNEEEEEIIKPLENSKVVAKLNQKKARAQFFEDMYNSSGISVNSSLTPEKPKRLCDMNLPSPRIGTTSPETNRAEGKEGKVELLAKQIEEKERINKSLDSETQSLNRSLEYETMKDDMVNDHGGNEDETEDSTHATSFGNTNALLEEIQEDLENIKKEPEEIKICILEAAKEPEEIKIEEDEEESTGIVKLQEILEEPYKEPAFDPKEDQEVEARGLIATQEILEASLEELQNSAPETIDFDETLPSTAKLLQTSMTSPSSDVNLENVAETKEYISELGEVNEVVETEEEDLEPSSLDTQNTVDVSNVDEKEEAVMKNVINAFSEVSEDTGASTDEGYDEERKVGGGAIGLMKTLKNEEELCTDDVIEENNGN